MKHGGITFLYSLRPDREILLYLWSESGYPNTKELYVKYQGAMCEIYQKRLANTE